MFGGNPVMDWHPIQGGGGVEILLVLPGKEPGLSAGLMDCLGHYADLTSTV